MVSKMEKINAFVSDTLAKRKISILLLNTDRWQMIITVKKTSLGIEATKV